MSICLIANAEALTSVFAPLDESRLSCLSSQIDSPVETLASARASDRSIPRILASILLLGEIEVVQSEKDTEGRVVTPFCGLKRYTRKDLKITFVCAGSTREETFLAELSVAPIRIPQHRLPFFSGTSANSIAL